MDWIGSSEMEEGKKRRRIGTEGSIMAFLLNFLTAVSANLVLPSRAPGRTRTSYWPVTQDKH